MFEKPLQYKKGAKVQKAIARDLLRFASEPLKMANSILDLGCGTGFLGEILGETTKIKSLSNLGNSQSYSSEIEKRRAHFTKTEILQLERAREAIGIRLIDGVDLSEDMLSMAKPFYNNLFLEDIKTFTPAQKYDLTLSSMCLQWLGKDIELIIEKFKEGFYFAIPMPESLIEISTCFKKEGLKTPIIEFIEPKYIKPDLIKIYTEPCQSLISALKSFNEIGAKNPNTSSLTHNQLKILERNFKKQITWKIGFFKA